MQKEPRIALAFNGSCMQKPAKLAVPEEKANPRDPGLAKDDFVRMGIELVIEAVEFRRDAHQDHEGSAQPTDMPEVFPLLFQHELPRKSPPYGYQGHEAFGHHGT